MSNTAYRVNCTDRIFVPSDAPSAPSNPYPLGVAGFWVRSTDSQPMFTDVSGAVYDLLTAANIAASDTVQAGEAAYAGAADDWAARQEALGAPETEEEAAQRLYDLALIFQERSQSAEARLLEDFASSAAMLSDKLGDFIIIDDEDERLMLRADGALEGEVQPEDDNGEWRRLVSPDDIVAFYDPTDVFGDLADALADAFPSVAPEDEGEDEGEDESEDAEDVEDVEDVEAVDTASEAGEESNRG
jgi:hypothetical protein